METFSLKIGILFTKGVRIQNRTIEALEERLQYELTSWSVLPDTSAMRLRVRVEISRAPCLSR